MSALKACTTNKAAAPAPQLAKAKKIADQVGVSRKTIFRWAAAGHISQRKISPRVILFDVGEVLQFVESGRIA